jgi:hypothetical protein
MRGAGATLHVAGPLQLRSAWRHGLTIDTGARRLILHQQAIERQRKS